VNSVSPSISDRQPTAIQESVDATSPPDIVFGIVPPLGSRIRIKEWRGAIFVDLVIVVSSIAAVELPAVLNAAKDLANEILR
jgi:hypothetical protein